MNQEQKQEQAYWAYQAKMENQQRMIDKGWGDREEYNKVLAAEAKRARIQRWKNLANEVFTGLMFVAVILFFVCLTQG